MTQWDREGTSAEDTGCSGNLMLARPKVSHFSRLLDTSCGRWP